MPLIKSSSDTARSENIATEIRAGRKPSQAAAIAYRVQREAKKKKMSRGGGVGYAAGGSAPANMARESMRALSRGVPGGIINSAVPGRSDQIPLSPKGKSYIVPADVVSSLGQGNTMAGAKGLNKLFGMGPYNMAPSKVPMPKRMGKFADGGGTEGNVDIMAAGGEFVIPPEKIAEIGGGDIERGTKILDAFVTKQRKKTIKTLRKLPGPRKR